MKTPKTTPNPNAERLRQLKQLFPECLTEGSIDAEKLQQIIYICEGGVKGVNRLKQRHRIGIVSIGQANAMPSACLASLPRLPSSRTEMLPCILTAAQTSSLKAIT